MVPCSGVSHTQEKHLQGRRQGSVGDGGVTPASPSCHCFPRHHDPKNLHQGSLQEAAKRERIQSQCWMELLSHCCCPRQFGGTVGFQLGKGSRKSQAPWGKRVLTQLNLLGGSKGLFMLKARLEVPPGQLPERSRAGAAFPHRWGSQTGAARGTGGKSHLCPAGKRTQSWRGPGGGDSSPDSSLRTLGVPALPGPPTGGFC